MSDLGVLALQGTPFAELLDHAARLTAEGLQADYCKILEYMPAENRLLVRAGVGWDEGVVGSASVGADLASPAGFALHTGKPVISNHLENEQRFRTPELLVEHGIRRAMNVILQGDGKPFGVLEVDSQSDGEFSEHDIAFLQGAANILGMAIEQQLANGKLKAALERHQILLKEINHRVKNSLQVVVAMLRLQASTSGDPQLRDALAEASGRVSTVGRAYERLAYNADLETIELVSYIREVCADLDKDVVPSRLQLDAPEKIEFAADRAILVALVINELVLNAARHAYPERSGGTIWVSITRAEPNVLLASVRDEGVGLPADYDPAKASAWRAARRAPLIEATRCRTVTAVRHEGHQFYVCASRWTAADSACGVSLARLGHRRPTLPFRREVNEKFNRPLRRARSPPPPRGAPSRRRDARDIRPSRGCRC